MENFPGGSGVVNEYGFRAAVEAVLGLLIQGKEVNTKNVITWVMATTDPIPSREVQGRATYYAERMINGPLRPDGSAPEIPPL